MTSLPLAPTLQAACERWADRPAVTFGDSTLSYGELWTRVERLARAYRDLGVQPGDRIVCQLRNNPEHVIAINAAWAVGAIHAGTDNDLTPGELAWLVERTEARVLVYEPPPTLGDPEATMAAVRSARPETTVLPHAAIATTTGDSDKPWTPRYAGPQDTALLLLTSGTTGRPKAVKETLPACWAKMQFFADAFGPAEDDVHLLFLPMGHVFGLRLSQLALLSGGRLVLVDRFSPTEVLGLVTEHRATVLPAMPTHLTLLLGALGALGVLGPSKHDTTSLRWVLSAASKLPRELVEAVYARFCCEILYVYGCSENFTTQTADRNEILAGSVGRAVFAAPPGEPPDGTVRVVTPDDHRPLPAGEVGEIAFGARRPVHYWRAPDSATDGWYYTGDLGRLDEDGRLYVLGRLKELVNRGGLKVSPSEVETAIAAHPAVADAAVLGTPDEVLGEAICACVVLATTPSPPPDLVAIREFLAATLARHKLPDELAIVEQIPRTKIGKVDRPALVAYLTSPGAPTRQRLRPAATGHGR